MRRYFKTAISEGRPIVAKCFVPILAGILCILFGTALSGCLAPPFLFPKTEGRGVVLDHHDNPVPNARLSASWFPVRILYMFAPVYHEDFMADKNGYWEFYERKVASGVIVEAIPFQGYASINGEVRTVQIPTGETRTNIVLRLRKIEEPSK